MGNVKSCFRKNNSSASINNGYKSEQNVFKDIKAPSSDAASNSSTNNGDKPRENVLEDSKTPSADVASSSTLESMLDDIKSEMDAGNVDPKDVISHLNNLISNIEENKSPEIVESPTGGFYGMVDKISKKWENFAKTEIPRELANIMASFLDKVGTSNYILVGFSVIGSILRRSLKVPRNKESCINFITDLKSVLAILHPHVSNNMSISASAFQDLANEIMKSISICCKYEISGFGNQMLYANALEAELKEAFQRLHMKANILVLDQNSRKLDHITSTHINVAENELDENTVGIKQRVVEVKRLLLLENKDVRGAAVVLHGQGGMGKSTLARTVISSAKPRASHGFTFASVCFDSERSDLETHKKELQSDMLKQLSGDKIKVDDIKAGQRELRKVFCSRHCFVFIDNVVQCGQLTDFFPDHLARDGNHSLRILVTSRDLDVRSYFPLHDEEVNVYDVDRLNDVSSVVALRKYMDVAESAQEKFSEEFVKIERIAKLCYGTPILLSTIGRDLKSRRSRPHYYDDVIRRLEAADFSKYNKLKLEDFILSVFNLLDEATKAAFLDICKFFYGWAWEWAMDVVGDTAMEELSDRLMIRKDVNSYGEWVMVHDLLRAMALRLVEKEKNRFEIKLDDDVSGCLELSQLVGSDVILSKIEGLFIDKWNEPPLPTIYAEPEVFQRLRLLNIVGVRLEFRNEDAECIPSKLEYLSVHSSYLGGVSRIFDWLKAENSSPPLRNLKLFEWNDEFLGNVEKFVNLERLELRYCSSLRELPSGISHLPRLREIILSECEQLQCLPQVGKLSCLMKLQLDGCSGLKTLPSSVAGLGRLAELNLNGCEQLQCLPEDIGELSSLTHLSMDDCCSLENLPTSLAKLGRLEMLSIRRCTNLVALPDEVGKLTCLKALILEGCSSLKTLPSSVAGLGRLARLNMNGCEQFQCRPEDIGELSSLTHLSMGGCCRLEDLRTILAKLDSLEMLSMRGCRNLVALPDEVGKLPCLKKIDLEDCSGLKTLLSSVAGLGRLAELNMNGCEQLQCLPEDIGEPSSLTHLLMDDCYSLENLPTSLAKLGRLEMLSMRQCTNLVALPDEVGKLTCLKALILEGCSSLKTLPSSVAGLGRLAKLNMNGCGQLQCLPEDIGELSRLTLLSMDECYSLENFPTSLEKLGSLEKLRMRRCRNLVALPDEVGKLPCLKKLILGGCSSLKTLPSSVAGLKALEKLDIDDCQQLHRLPEDIGELSSLKVLFMDNLSSLETLPSSLAKLTSLEYLTMNGWSNMVTVPDFISDLYTLKELCLHDCYNLKELPAYLEGFTNMEELWLDNCKALETLPDLGKMRSLRMILLRGCSKLQIILPSIAELRDLIYLDIRDCTSIQNAQDFIQNMSQVFRNSGKDPSLFLYDSHDSGEGAGILES